MTQLSQTALVPLAEGFEEIEAITIIDLLRRGGIEVTTAHVTKTNPVVGAHNIPVKADCSIVDVTKRLFGAVVLPGGLPGATNLAESPTLEDVLGNHNSKGSFVAAICAAPTVLSKYGYLKGKKATAYPGFDQKLDAGKITQDEVVEDGNIITSRGPGTAISFALTMIEKLAGKTKADEVRAQILLA